MDDLFQEAILDEARDPRNVGRLEQPAVRMMQTNASCGDEITVELQFSKDNEQITHIGWYGTGCTISQAAMSLVSELVTTISVAQVQELTQSDIEPLLGLERISPGRLKCLMLGLHAIQKAILEYQAQVSQ